MELVATYQLDEENSEYNTIEVYDNGVTLIKSGHQTIVTRHNPTESYSGIGKAGGLGKTSNRIDAEVQQILEQLGVEDAVSRRLARAWVSGKAQSLSSGLELLRRNSSSDTDTVTIEEFAASGVRITGGPFEGEYASPCYDETPEEREESKARIKAILNL